eukprot:6193004-Pleurochrysis_carterae.AAC.14
MDNHAFAVCNLVRNMHAIDSTGIKILAPHTQPTTCLRMDMVSHYNRDCVRCLSCRWRVQHQVKTTKSTWASSGQRSKMVFRVCKCEGWHGKPASWFPPKHQHTNLSPD